MRIKCEYCDHYLDDTEAKCPNCGAPNANMMRSASGVPKTVEELQAFCLSHNLPLKQMRFFIGEDYKEPRAFGIFQDGDGDFVVYKNKADGSRAIRYEGKDEAYAVNEIYQKLKTEMTAQKQSQRQAQGTPASAASKSPQKKKGRGCLIGCLAVFLIFTVLAIIGLIIGGVESDRNSYSSGYSSGQSYDSGSGSWQWDDDSDSSGGSWLWDDDDSGSSWDNWSSWDDDWDSSDWDWDSGSDWDSGGSDWDSDW